ncbi:hypothetical protein [Methylobacterium tarhaniae]|uniref:hypothetical protein n=1 Tax=Methylobacterium tarhaniae TaxID=1187852 RepID=UPI0012EDC6A3|nr:hypothetical protein [Methylobacterium tarhaniae]
MHNLQDSLNTGFRQRKRSKATVMALELLIAAEIASIAKSVFRRLGARYFLEMDDLLPKDVTNQYNIALSRGTKAVAAYLEKEAKLSSKDLKFVAEFFKSAQVAEELSKLLDPGVEIFDTGALTQSLYKHLKQSGMNNISEFHMLEAWRAFEKAFSFSSRSSPELREFLRASYDVGSFRAISNVNYILEQIEIDIDQLTKQEKRFSSSLKDYEEELINYKDWAAAQRAKIN